jgi:pimeloyl-ACP methyl ester carboxylesterase
MRRRAGLALAALATIVLPGCRWLPRAAAVPMPLQREPLSANTQAPVLAVLLPGAYSFPRDFVDEGFIAALRSRNFAVDVWLADAHRGYAANATLLERVHEDVLLPAQRAGYRRIWLVGISLGGLAALGSLQRHAPMIDGVLLLSPYLGEAELVHQVAQAGGVQAFAQRAPPAGDLITGLWAWLGSADTATLGKIHLATGSHDRFIDAHRLLAALLPADQALELPGGHDWATWRALWARWLAHAPWPRAVSRAVRTP